MILALGDALTLSKGTLMQVREQLERAWGLATLPMASENYSQAVLQFLAGSGVDGVCPRALLMFELAVEIHLMRGSFEHLLISWPRGRSDTAPMTPRALSIAGAA